jgi:hypothetical protein
MALWALENEIEKNLERDPPIKMHKLTPAPSPKVSSTSLWGPFQVPTLKKRNWPKGRDIIMITKEQRSTAVTPRQSERPTKKISQQQRQRNHGNSTSKEPKSRRMRIPAYSLKWTSCIHPRQMRKHQEMR